MFQNPDEIRILKLYGIRILKLYGIRFSMPFIFSSSITTAVFPKLSCTLAL